MRDLWTEDRCKCGDFVSILHLRMGHQALRSCKNSESGVRREAGRERRGNHRSFSFGLSFTLFTSQIKQVSWRAVVTKHESVHGNPFLQRRAPASPPTGQSAPGEATGASVDWSVGDDVTEGGARALPLRVRAFAGGGVCDPSS